MYYCVVVYSIVTYISLFSLRSLAVPQQLYLDSYKTCNQLDYVVDEYRTYSVATTRRQEIGSRVFIKCHMTFKAKEYNHKICFTMMEFSPDSPKCNMIIKFYDGDSVKTGVGAKFDCETKYSYPYQWCSGGQFAMIVLDRTSSQSTSRDITAFILVQQQHNPHRTVYLDSQCSSLHLMDRTTITVKNRHSNNSLTPPMTCDQSFEYIGDKTYPICVTIYVNKSRLTEYECPFRVSVGDNKPTSGSTILDEWTCGKISPHEICSEGSILTIFMYRLTHGSTKDPPGLFTLTVQDRTPAPETSTNVTTVVLSVFGVILGVFILYILLAVYLEQKKGIYIGPCCICRKHCKGYSTDDSLTTGPAFTSVSTKDPGHGRIL